MNQPKLYSKHKDMQTRDNVYVISTYSKFIKWTNDEETVLDIGCGEGYTTLQVLMPILPKNFKKIIGCDISDKMVKYAKDSYEKDGRADFCQMDIGQEVPDKEFHQQFDHVFSFYCLHWVSAQKKAFENIYNFLKPGGDFLASILVTAPIYSGYEKMSKNIRWAPYFKQDMISPYHNSEKPDEEVKEILDNIGFEDCKCIIENRHYAFNNWHFLRRSIVAVNPIIPLLPPQDKLAYINDFMGEIHKVYGYDKDKNEDYGDYEINVHYKLMIVYGSKPKNNLYVQEI